MLRSLYSGVSGMRSFQTKMDVIANNIANVNTTGFKSGRVKFQDMLSQTVANAQSPTANLGGVNPQQIGLGVRVGSIDTIMEGGALQPTNRGLDFAIEGEGFFIVNDGSRDYYTRDGAFYTDYEGNLVNASGFKVRGYLQDEEGTAINMDDEYDEDERPSDLLERPEADQDYQEQLETLRPLKISQFLTSDGSVADAEDGEYELQEFTIDGTGQIIGVYSRMDPESDEPETITFLLGQVAMTKFQNPEGLEKAGNNNYINTTNSGRSELGVAGGAGYGVVRQGFLEMSNVDLANEFTEMIVTSRAYQANSRSITTSDEMLQELINLKR